MPKNSILVAEIIEEKYIHYQKSLLSCCYFVSNNEYDEIAKILSSKKASFFHNNPSVAYKKNRCKKISCEIEINLFNIIDIQKKLRVAKKLEVVVPNKPLFSKINHSSLIEDMSHNDSLDALLSRLTSFKKAVDRLLTILEYKKHTLGIK